MSAAQGRLSGRRWSRVLGLVTVVGVVLAIGLVGAAPASAATVAGFEIDGDMVSQGADDWATVGGQPAATDPVSSADDDAFAGPSAGELNPAGWIVERAQVSPAQGDIGDIYAFGRVFNDEQYAFLGFVRAASSGSILINVELNQRPNTTNAHGVSIPDRQVGDLLIDVTKSGGAPPTVTNVYEWNGSTWVVQPGAASRVVSATNTGPIVDVKGNTVPTGQFAELAINLGTVLGQATCPGIAYPVVNMRTRASPAITSQLKDYVHAGAMNVPSGCGQLAIRKVDPNGNPLPGATFEISPNPIPGETGTLTVQDGSPADQDGAANGEVLLTEILPGEYTVTEVDPPPGYLPGATSQQVTVPEGGRGTLDFTDTPIVVDILLRKAGELADENGNGVADAGETINYTVTVTNTGNVPLTEIAVNDPKVGPVTCAATELAPGEQTTCTAAPYAVSQADVEAGLVRNEATATGQGPSSEEVSSDADFEVPANATSGLVAIKTGTLVDENGNGVADVGETINYSFTVINTGTLPLTGITVDDPKVGPVTCEATELAPGARTTCTAAPYTVTQADIDAGQVRNVATATGTPPGGTPVESPETTETLPVDNTAGLLLEKSADLVDEDGDGLADPGETINHTFTVINTGNVTLTGITVNDPKVGPVTCATTELAPGARTTCTAAPYTVTQADIDAGTVRNVATATGTTPQETPVESPEVEAAVPVDDLPRLVMEKSPDLADEDGDGLADPGETVDYTFVLTNTGNVPLTGITVDDPKVGPVTCQATELAPGAQTTCTATYTVTAADVNAGAVVNVATATAFGPGDREVSWEADASVPADTTPGLGLAKAAELADGNGNGLADAGETITYTFTVTNTGNVTLTGITVDDPKVGPVTCQATDLDAGARTTCTATYRVTQADVDAGAVRNVATATGTTPQETPVESGPAEQTVRADDTPGLTVVKSAELADTDGNGLADVGETIHYTFTVTNTGRVTLQSITIDDPKAGAVTCPAGALAPGEVRLCTASYVVTQADLDAGKVRNVATANGTTPDGNQIESAPGESTVDANQRQETGEASGLPTTGFTTLGPLLLGLALLATGGTVLARTRRGRP